MSDKKTNQHDEKLSRLMDGDLNDEQFVDNCLGDEALQQKWSRYHLARDAMHNDIPDQGAVDMVERVRNALQDEPAHQVSNKEDKGFFGRYAFALSLAIAVVVGIPVAVVNVQDGQGVVEAEHQVGQGQLVSLPDGVRFDQLSAETQAKFKQWIESADPSFLNVDESIQAKEAQASSSEDVVE